MDWQSIDVSVVGGGTYIFWLRSLLLDYHPGDVLHKRMGLLHLSFVVLIYPTQTWDLAYFPLNDDNPYDRLGQYYNVSRVLDSSNRFNLTAYNEYSPLYLPATYAMTYLLAFALSTCVLVHTALYHGRSLLNGMKKIRSEQDDIHAKLMRNYPEVPDWWYIVFFVGFFLMMVVVVEVRHTCVRSVPWFPHRFFPRSLGMAYVCASVGTTAVRLLANLICIAFWLHLRNDWSRGKIYILYLTLKLTPRSGVVESARSNHSGHPFGW
jgi:hypothetical protein